MDKTEKLIDWEENERKDRNRNGIDDRIEPAIPDVEAGTQRLAERLRENNGVDPSLSGGDIDAQWEMAESQGDEAATGSQSTPGQNDTEETAAAMGISYADDEELKVGEKERSRDEHRWELDPASSDDYQERVKDQS
ncbi:MAG TPA: DUF6335 family protein [Thermoanaerobaculia bacterium]|jgi:hypothetical protein|nr:DUF6335 family protein [Thermoanaerobaculia bacterium]